MSLRDSMFDSCVHELITAINLVSSIRFNAAIFTSCIMAGMWECCRCALCNK